MKAPDILNCTALKKVFKTAARLADLCTGEDLEADMKVIRDATRATHRVFDKDSHSLIEVPDHKTRLAAITLRRAYAEGLPVKREEIVQVNIDGDEEAQRRMFQSPTLRAALRRKLEEAGEG